MTQPQEFEADVHYNDWKGTAAADNCDYFPADQLLEEKNLLKEDEHVAGISISSSGSHNGPEREPAVDFHVGFLLKKIGDQSSAPVIRIESVDLSLTELFALFKRFELKISRLGTLTEYIEDDTNSEAIDLD